MNAGEQLSATDALEEIGRMRRRIGRKGRAVGWLFLVWGVASVFYWSAMFFGPPALRLVAVIGWLAIAVTSCYYSYRQGVQSPGYHRLQRVVTTVWSLTVAGAGVFAFAVPRHPTAWWIPGGIAIAVVTALPVLYAAWRLRPWEKER